MFEEFYPFLVTTGIIIIIIYGIKKVSEICKARVIAVGRGAAGGKPGQQLPNSLYELFSQLEKGLDVQVQEIAARCNKEGKNPLEDVGYKTILNQYQKVVDIRTNFEGNPFYILADQIFWPVVKQMIPDAVGLARRMMRGLA